MQRNKELQVGDRVIAKDPYKEEFITGTIYFAKAGSGAVVIESDDDGSKYIRRRDDVRRIT